MCGIFGAIKLDDSPNLEETKVSEGVRLLKHRGPDGFGVSTTGAVSFGHTRLSIIDLALGHQPMQDAKEYGLITYNGEVYNFREVRKRLEKEGLKFNTNSDTEVVLNAFLYWGEACLDHFRGMFAFACLDRKKKKVLLARDRIGKKPLFYVRKNHTLYFSSELDPLYKTVGPFKMDLQALDDYLYWQYIPAPRTIYNGVYCLPPAHYLLIDLATGEIEEKRYWDLQFREDRSLGFDDWLVKLDDAVREAVKLRLVSDVPFGAFLSGGIDSSLVVGYMADIMEQPVKTFSIGFENSDYSELKYAKKVAEICETEHYTQIVKAESLKILPALVKHYGQPFADSSAIPTYYVSRMARDNVKMVLSGDGGDENFAGYNTYEYIVSRQPKCGETGFAELLKRYALKWCRRGKTSCKLDKKYSEVFQLYSMVYNHFPPQERSELYKAKYGRLVDEEQSFRRRIVENGEGPLLSRLQLLDILTYLPYDILTKVDIASMANSLEVRTPLLDHKLMETAATIPVRFKLREEKSNGVVRYDKKHILKALTRKRFPGEIIDRPKWGFGIPLGEWFAGELKEEVRTRIMQSDCLPEFFKMDYLEGIINHHSPANDMSPKLWNLLFLEEWMKQHEGAL